MFKFKYKTVIFKRIKINLNLYDLIGFSSTIGLFYYLYLHGIKSTKCKNIVEYWIYVEHKIIILEPELKNIVP